MAQDAGSHTFSLALSFNSAGTYTIEGRDINDTQIFGTLTAAVTSVAGAQSDLIKLTNPVAGSFSNNVQAVSGTSTPGSKIGIYDNNVILGTATVDATGNFIYVTSPLADGDHEMFVALTNDIGTITASSDKVKFKIDTTAPKLDKVEFSPDGGAAGSSVEARVYSEQNLSQVTITISDKSYEMKYSDQGYYAAKVTAPMSAGSYPSKVTLVDALGNKAVFDKEKALSVGLQALTDPEALPSGNGGTNVTNPGASLEDVTNLVAFPGDHQITLSWKAPSKGVPVQVYRILYGLAPNQLKYAVDTFNANTKWYIPDLKNGTTYYFAVVAIANDNQSAHLSNIVTGIPGSSKYVPQDILNGTAGKDDLKNLKGDVSDTGPETTFILGLALIGGLIYGFSRKKSLGRF
jgi:hypothetical protein